MTGVVAVVGEATPSVTETGRALARLLHAGVRHVGPLVPITDDSSGALIEELEVPDVAVVVVPDGHAVEDGTGRLLRAYERPVVVTPEKLCGPVPFAVARVLLPLDGSPEAAAAVAPTAELLADAGVDLVVVHVFQPETVPRFWDQAAHARHAWEPEFLARYLPQPGVRLHLRAGVAGENVLAVAAEEGVNLIVLGWSQRLDSDRAATVRATLAEARVPVMLMPVPD